jgi:hypothetical protein
VAIVPVGRLAYGHLVTASLEAVVAAADAPPRRRRVWLLVTVGVVVFALIGGGIGWLVYIHTYQPLADGGGSGRPTRSIQATWDGTVDTRLVIVGPQGTTGVAEYVIRNDGGFPVRLLGLDKSQAAFFVTGMKWSSLSADNHGNGSAQGLLSQARNFPVTLQPNESVFIQLAVIKPKCQSGIDLEMTGIPIRWSALGVHHVWNYALTVGGATELPISACPSKSALEHIDNQ